MVPWTLTDKAEYLRLELRAHIILSDIQLYEVWALDLPGGGEGRTVADIRSLDLASSPGSVVSFLFAMRWFIGKIFKWDQVTDQQEGLFLSRLSEADRAHSSVIPGTKDGPFTVLYVHPAEAMSEIRNKTVHAALVWTLVSKPRGYRLLWGIYVKPAGRLTSTYMAFIKPFRYWLVYPSLLKRLYTSWCSTYPPVD